MIFNFIILFMTDNHYIETNKYRLEIQESWEDRKILVPPTKNTYKGWASPQC